MRISDWSSDVCSSDLPVTLELGGKSPTFIGRSANRDLVGQRVAMGKLMNAGQICLAPDYLLVAEDQEDAVIDSVARGAASLYPTLLANDDYTSVVNGRNYDRLHSYLDRKSTRLNSSH